MSDAAVALKNEGNAAFGSGDYVTAIAKFTAAIEADPTYHVAYSNRSASYANTGEYEAALADAEKVIEVKPAWPKGYLRKATALQFLERSEDAVAAYDAGLAATDNDASIAAAKDKLEAELASSAANPLASIFGPDVWVKIAGNPQTSGYMSDPSFVQMITNVQNNPSSMNAYMQDPRFQAVFMMLLGANMPAGAAGGEDGGSASSPGEGAGAADARAQAKAEAEAAAKEAEQAAAEAEEEDEEAAAAREQLEAATAIKLEGNALYKKKDLAGAMAKYQEAKAMVPTHVVFFLNIASVHIELGEFDECLAVCEEAMAVARDAMAGFQMYAKILVKRGNCCLRAERYDEAVAAYEAAQREHRTAATLKLLNGAKKARRAAATAAYIDPEKAALAKAEGDDFFRSGDYPAAVKSYSEAIKRDPSNHKPLSNRAAALIKLGALPDALADCDAALAIDPSFIRAYMRKGQIYFILKQFHKCIDAYMAVTEIEPSHAGAAAEMAKVEAAVRERELNPVGSEEEQEAARQQALSDPDLRDIYSSPDVQAALQALSSDPAKGRELMADPIMSIKILKLRAAGILRFA